SSVVPGRRKRSARTLSSGCVARRTIAPYSSVRNVVGPSISRTSIRTLRPWLAVGCATTSTRTAESGAGPGDGVDPPQLTAKAPTPNRSALHRSALHRSALHRSALHRSALHRSALHRSALHRIPAEHLMEPPFAPPTEPARGRR